MKIKTVKGIEIAGNMESVKAGIDESSKTFMYEMLSNLYQNPIGSIVREYTSNCFDSHIEAGVEDAVIIRKINDEEGTCISFNDVGVGLSPKRMMKVFMNYFSSTKRESNNLIGGFGLGSKSGLSYSNYFYINTVFNGLAYNYIYSKGEREPELDSLNGFHEEPLVIKTVKYTEVVIDNEIVQWPYVSASFYPNPVGIETTERNGTEIKIVIENNYDVNRYESELKKQLCYFDSVWFEGWNIDNDYVIYEKNYFRYRNTYQYSDEIHILLGKVPYPIDWNILEIKRVEIPIGVKFEIGELIVTPNREGLRYTDEIKELVRQRIKLAHDELLSLYEEERMEYDDFFEWIKEKDQRKKIKFSEDDTLYLKGEKDLSATYYKEFRGYKFKKKIFDSFSTSHFGFRPIGQFREGKLNSRSLISNLTYNIINDLNTEHLVFCDNLIFQEVKNKYHDHNYGVIKDKVNLRDIYQRYFHNPFSDYKYTDEDYNRPLGMPTGWAKQTYEFYKEVCNLILSRIENYYSEDLTPEFIEQFKREKREKDASLQRKLNGKVLVKNFFNFNYFREDEWKVSDIEKKTNIVVYAFRDERRELDQSIAILLSNKSFRNPDNGKELHCIERERRHGLNRIIHRVFPCQVIQIARANAKYFKNKPNMLHISELKGDNIVFRKLATALKIEDSLFLKAELEMDQVYEINRVIGAKLRILKKFIRETFGHNGGLYNRELRNSILEIAQANNLFYEPMEIHFRDINTYFKGLELLKYIKIDRITLPLIVKTLYDNKRRLNFEYYMRYVEEPVVTSKETQMYIEFKDEEIEEPQITKYESIIESVELMVA